MYCRISEDPRDSRAGVDRQREDCEAIVRARGWDLAGAWTDNDIAVLRPGAARPGYTAMMTAVERGEVTRIVAYGLSRLWRNRRERADAIETLRQHRVSIALVKGSDLDLSSAAGRMVAGLLGETDTMESELKAERVARAAQQRAEQGRASGHVLYGWRRERVRNEHGDVIDWRDELDSEQAKIVAEIVDRLLAGEPIKAVTGDLNDRGVPGPRGGGWIPSGVRKVALRPANAALRVHHREVIGPAAWPEIIDRDRHDRVVALLSDPARSTSRSGARRHLLTYGVGECGRCGAVLKVTRRGGHEMYACTGPRGCVGRRREWVDDLVERVIVGRLERPDARDLLVRDDGAATEARERAAGVRARLDGAADDYAAGLLDRDQLRRITARLRPELETAEAEAARSVQGVDPGMLATLAGPEAATRWGALSVPQKRALMDTFGLRVRLLPGLRGGPGFKPESVEIEWITDDASRLGSE